MADCKSYATDPIKVEVNQPSVTLYGGFGNKVAKTYFAQIDECKGANMTIYDVTDKKNSPKPVGNSNKENSYNFKIEDNSLSKETQKSIEEEVYNKNFKSIRATNINKLDPSVISLNFADVPGVKNVEKTEEQRAQESAVTRESTTALQSYGVANANQDKEPLPKILYYPEKYGQYKQDYIKFQILEYKPRIFNFDNQSRLARYVGLKDEKTGNPLTKENFIRSTIILPIQGGISDSNAVSWNAEPMNAIEQAAAFKSLMSQTSMDLKSEMGTVIDAYKKLLTGPKSNTAISSYLHAYFARMAANSGSNFFSRAFGAILNPNLELLFQTPELRSFSLRFDLTPRDEPEAKQVKQIIRVFKQTMAPRKGVADIFLKTPMIFDITYINGKLGKEHTSINKIKTCALKMFNVNYTPNNQYMTYNDAESTMTAYSLDMQFVELEPVFYDDYIGMPYQEIGY